MLKGVVRFFNLLHIALVTMAKILLVAMVLIIFANVVLRYGFSSGLQWSEELGLLMAVWFSFIMLWSPICHGLVFLQQVVQGMC